MPDYTTPGENSNEFNTPTNAYYPQRSDIRKKLEAMNSDRLIEELNEQSMSSETLMKDDQKPQVGYELPNMYQTDTRGAMRTQS